MALLRNPQTLPGFCVLCLSATLLFACPEPETPTAAGGEDASADALEASAGKQAKEHNSVAYGEDGLLVASRLKSLGAAIPRGFKRIHVETGRSIYVGPAPGKQVMSFYQHHLDCANVKKLGRGWKFFKATPKVGEAPRTLDITVVEESAMHSRIILSDVTVKVGVKAPDAGGPAYQDLYKAAHKGVGSVKAPIPGTY